MGAKDWFDAKAKKTSADVKAGLVEHRRSNAGAKVFDLVTNPGVDTGAAAVKSLVGLGSAEQRTLGKGSEASMQVLGRRLAHQFNQEVRKNDPADGVHQRPEEVRKTIAKSKGFLGDPLRRASKDPQINELGRHLRTLRSMGPVGVGIAQGFEAENRLHSDRDAKNAPIDARSQSSYPANLNLVQKTTAQVGSVVRKAYTAVDKTPAGSLALTTGSIAAGMVAVHLKMHHGVELPELPGAFDNLDAIQQGVELAKGALAHNLDALGLNVSTAVGDALAAVPAVAAAREAPKLARLAVEAKDGSEALDFVAGLYVRSAMCVPSDADEVRAGISDASEGLSIDAGRATSSGPYADAYHLVEHLKGLGRQGNDLASRIREAGLQYLVTPINPSPHLLSSGPTPSSGSEASTPGPGRSSTAPSSPGRERPASSGGGALAGQVNVNPEALESIGRGLEAFADGLEEATTHLRSALGGAGESWDDWFYVEVSAEVAEIVQSVDLAERVDALRSRVASKLEAVERMLDHG